MLKTVYCKFSNDRCPQYAIRTNILQDENGTKYVEKCPMTKAAEGHIARMLRSEKELARLYEGTILEPNRSEEIEKRRCFAFVEGETLSARLDALLAEGEKEGFFALFEEYADLVKKVTAGNDKSHGAVNIDLIPDNILIADGRWIVIDYEWTLDAEIPAEFILFRGVHYYIGYPKDSRMGLSGEELYAHFGFDKQKIDRYFIWEEKFQAFVDGDYTKLETLKYRHHKPIVSMEQVMAEAAGGEMYELEIVSCREDGTIARSFRQSAETDFCGGIKLHIALAKDETQIRIGTADPELLLHVKGILAQSESENQPLSFQTDGKPLGEFNVVCLKKGNSVFFSFEEGRYRSVDVALGCLSASQNFRDALKWERAESEEEKKRLTARMLEAEKKNAQADVMMEIVQLRQEQIRQLRETGSIHYLGRLMNKLKGYDPIRALRPPLDQEESGIRFFIDEIRYREYGLFVRGWVFHNQGYPVTICIRDEKGRGIDAYVQKIKRDDVSAAFDVPVETVRGYAFTIERKKLRTEKLYLEFETLGGYLAKEIKAYGRKRDRKLWQENLQDSSEYRIEYDFWAKHTALGEKQLRRQRRHRFSYRPLISVVVPLFNTPLHFLETMIQSVLQQTYSNVQLCLADGSTNDEAGNYIKEHYGNDGRVKYQRLAENKGISGNTVEAVKMADGEFLMLCDHDDEVMLHACYEMVKALNEDGEIDAVYTDEDKMTMDGKFFFDPHFKPDYNLEFLRSNNYICHIFLVRKSIVDSLGEIFRSRFDGAQDYDFILRCCEKARKVYHVPRVCYHWRSHPLSTAGNPESKDYAYEAGRASVAASYERRGIPAEVTRTKYFGRYRTEFAIVGSPAVRVVVAAAAPELTKQQLKTCIRSLYENTDYGEFTVCIVYDESREDLQTAAKWAEKTYKGVCAAACPAGSSMSRAYNTGADLLTGGAACDRQLAESPEREYLLFLEGSAIVCSGSWMKEMLGCCQQRDVAVCGAKILYPDDRIWHGGMVLGLNGTVGRLFDGMPKEEFSYQGWANSARDVSAVSGVCMMASRAVFQRLQGFDAVVGEAYYDADFCLRAGEADYRNIYNPYAEIYFDNAREASEETAGTEEEKRFRERWSRLLAAGDPCYNSNLSLKYNNCNLKEL